MPIRAKWYDEYWRWSKKTHIQENNSISEGPGSNLDWDFSRFYPAYWGITSQLGTTAFV
jgi:hypothetical protein